MQVHGSLGLSEELPLVDLVLEGFHLRLADGPTEVHLVTLARLVLRDYEATTDLVPTRHRPRLLEQARAKYADVLAAADAR